MKSSVTKPATAVEQCQVKSRNCILTKLYFFLTVTPNSQSGSIVYCPVGRLFWPKPSQSQYFTTQRVWTSWRVHWAGQNWNWTNFSRTMGSGPETRWSLLSHRQRGWQTTIFWRPNLSFATISGTFWHFWAGKFGKCSYDWKPTDYIYWNDPELFEDKSWSGPVKHSFAKILELFAKT